MEYLSVVRRRPLSHLDQGREPGGLVEEDVSLEPVGNGVLDLVSGKLARGDVEHKVHLCVKERGRFISKGPGYSCRNATHPRASNPWSPGPRR